VIEGGGGGGGDRLGPWPPNSRKKNFAVIFFFYSSLPIFFFFFFKLLWSPMNLLGSVLDLGVLCGYVILHFFTSLVILAVLFCTFLLLW
jgi:hypothetical protein